MIRAMGEKLRAGSLRSGLVLSASGILALATPARAEDATAGEFLTAAFAVLGHHEVFGLALTIGLACFTVVTTILLLRTRTRAGETEAAQRHQITSLTAELDRVNALLLSEPQIVVAWAAAADRPEIMGDPSFVTSATTPQRVLAFGTWLGAEAAQAMEHAVDKLRSQGEGFSLSVKTLAGQSIEAEGRAIGGRAVLRLRNVSGVKYELVALQARYQEMVSVVDSLRTLIDALPSPVWVRSRTGALEFVNSAYVAAVEARDAVDAVDRGLELLDASARDAVASGRASASGYRGRLPAIVAGARRHLDVIEVRTQSGSAGLGFDATEIETMRESLAHMVDAHRRTLDRLTTAVAIFTGDGKLNFYNAAYRALWDLDPAFLDTKPADSTILDRLRAARKLPEEHDFRQWKAQLHEAYRTLETREHLWHLSDGRALRVVTGPNPEGGVTYLFDDVTERLDLERRYDSLIRVQGETLDNLAEAVAVFASDGRLRLYNPAFSRMWKLAPEALAERPHIEAVIAWCGPLHPEDATLRALRATVTAIDGREPVSGRLERRDGSVVDLATLPLPDGATLVTFQDVTDSVNVERALRERNEALVEADEIKIDFLHHVSYELRSPLTNIIGFTHFLDDPATGPLNAKQTEYLGYITVSTRALLAIINDILDLATIDAGAMTLSLGPVEIRKTMEGAAEGIRDRLVKDEIKLEIGTPADIGSFTADERRVRQVLFNLLSNAVGFSPAGGTVRLSAERRDGAIVFTVTDQGPGIPAEMTDRIFKWFESHPLGSQHRGAGLGLSIVRSFVELHGGRVRVDSAVGRGTSVICTFPLDQAAARTAAE
jgi:signal transduction histidine kinase